MPQRVNVSFLPELSSPQRYADQTTVVIDVLRATTSIVYALASGARQVIPCLRVAEARQLATKHGSGVVLGGERDGRRIDGFDLGNSPTEYTPEAVQGKTVIFTTTNGTKAMQHCRLANRVLIGAFVNFSAVCDRLTQEQHVEILCAGTRGAITREDVLLAGAFAHELRQGRAGGQSLLDDQAAIAAESWVRVQADFAAGTPLAESLRDSSGARNLIEIGLERDIEIASQIDRFDLTPELDLASWAIRLP